MKYYHILAQTVFFLFATIAFISCSKEQVLINKIEGNYKIEKTVVIKGEQEFEVAYTNSILFFEKCKLKDKVAQQCSGYYQIEGQNRIAFDYFPEKQDGKELMRINIGNLSLEPYFGGSYRIENRTENSFTLTRYTYDQSLNKIYDLRIYLKK